MLYKGMVSKSKYWISEKIRVMSTQKRRKNPYARVLVLCQVPLETIMRVCIYNPKILETAKLTYDAIM